MSIKYNYFVQLATCEVENFLTMLTEQWSYHNSPNSDSKLNKYNPSLVYEKWLTANISKTKR
jgi:hypothetical protein